MDLGLKGKVVVVTGSSMGIGFAIAEMLVAEGAKVAICSTNHNRIKAAGEKLKELGGDVFWQEVDMTVEKQVYEFSDNVVRHFGTIDSWVNNVGAQLTKKDDEEFYSDELLERIYAICFKSAVFGCQAAFKHMKMHGGTIVNISSLGARCPTIGKATLYGPLKSAVCKLTLTMAGEYAAWGIRVNCVMPGYTMTEYNKEHTDPEAMKAICEGTFLNRAGTVDEVARPVVFLCGNGSGFITGESLEVSGGRGLSLNSMYSWQERERRERVNGQGESR